MHQGLRQGRNGFSFLLFTTIVILLGNFVRSFSFTPSSHFTRPIQLSMLSPSSSSSPISLSTKTISKLTEIESQIGQDAGNRGMKALIQSGDLHSAAAIAANLPPSSHVVLLSGFPCCVNHDPPTETDGPPGTVALVKCALALGFRTTLVTDKCNEHVFAAAVEEFMSDSRFALQVYSPCTSPDASLPKEEERKMEELVLSADLIIACERAGPAKDGNCYTMRGINMTERGLIAPLERIVHRVRELKDDIKFIAIGDGGNEMGMGKAIDAIRNSPKIENGDLIGAVTPADFLIAASVSNWGGYALAAAVALVKSEDCKEKDLKEWIESCVPTESSEVALLERCVSKGCRDGVSGLMEATVDGMSLDTSMQCLQRIRSIALGH